MNKTASADIVIFGGGIAGLWLLNRLRQSGLSAILFESNLLGGGQTNKSQGIIHGGMKYALKGVMTKDANAMLAMPGLWQDCLDGHGELDLSNVPVLAKQQHLWSPNKFTSKIAGLFASAALTSQVTKLDKANYPDAFSHPGFKGDVYALNEMIVDVPALVRELVKANQDAIFKIEPLGNDELTFDSEGKLVSATACLAGKALEIHAQHFVFTAGSGNEVILRRLPEKQLDMQLRPLRMVMMKTKQDYPLYAHCLGLGARPRITITTHYCQDGHRIWYMGGMLAEDGVNRTEAAQITAAKKELRTLFPWLDFTDAEFATFTVDRAEPKQQGALKPETAFAKHIANMTVAWPTKLALAPKLAQDIIDHFKQKEIKPACFDVRELRAWPMPPVARPIWEDLFCKKDNLAKQI